MAHDVFGEKRNMRTQKGERMNEIVKRPGEFQPGNPGGGRPSGARNVLSRYLLEDLIEPVKGTTEHPDTGTCSSDRWLVLVLATLSPSCHRAGVGGSLAIPSFASP
jgi:hypothetical protein